jgi:hypothetical protein
MSGKKGSGDFSNCFSASPLITYLSSLHSPLEEICRNNQEENKSIYLETMGEMLAAQKYIIGQEVYLSHLLTNPFTEIAVE